MKKFRAKIIINKRNGQINLNPLKRKLDTLTKKRIMNLKEADFYFQDVDD